MSLSKVKNIFPFVIVVVLFQFVIDPSRGASAITYKGGPTGWRISNSLQFQSIPSEEAKPLRSMVLNVVSELKSRASDFFEDAAFKKLVEDLQRVNFEIVTSGYLAPQGRLGGFAYRVETSTVYIEMETMSTITKMDRVSINTIFLHEMLGAIGVADDGYEVSALITGATFALISTQKGSAEEAGILKVLPLLRVAMGDRIGDARRHTVPLEKSYEGIEPVDDVFKKDIKSIKLAGGFTGVGGGGDPIAAGLKAMLIRDLLLSKSGESKFVNWVVNGFQLETVRLTTEKMDLGLKRMNTWPGKLDDTRASMLIKQEKGVALIRIWVDGDSMESIMYKNLILEGHLGQILWEEFEKIP